MALFELKKFYDSIVCYNKAIKIFPKDSNYYFDKGIVLNELKKYDQEYLCLKKSIEINPNKQPIYYYNMIKCLIKLARYKEAFKVFNYFNFNLFNLFLLPPATPFKKNLYLLFAIIFPRSPVWRLAFLVGGPP